MSNLSNLLGKSVFFCLGTHENSFQLRLFLSWTMNAGCYERYHGWIIKKFLSSRIIERISFFSTVKTCCSSRQFNFPVSSSGGERYFGHSVLKCITKLQAIFVAQFFINHLHNMTWDMEVIYGIISDMEVIQGRTVGYRNLTRGVMKNTIPSCIIMAHQAKPCLTGELCDLLRRHTFCTPCNILRKCTHYCRWCIHTCQRSFSSWMEEGTRYRKLMNESVDRRLSQKGWIGGGRHMRDACSRVVRTHLKEAFAKVSNSNICYDSACRARRGPVTLGNNPQDGASCAVARAQRTPRREPFPP